MTTVILALAIIGPIGWAYSVLQLRKARRRLRAASEALEVVNRRLEALAPGREEMVNTIADGMVEAWERALWGAQRKGKP